MLYSPDDPTDRDERAARRTEAVLRRALEAIRQTDRLLDASSQILRQPTRYAESGPDEIRYRVLRECGLHDRDGACLRDGDVVCRSRIAEGELVGEMVQAGNLVQDDYHLRRLPNLVDRSGDGTWLA